MTRGAIRSVDQPQGDRGPAVPKPARSLGASMYLIIGVLTAHLLHVWRFYLVGWSSIRALPDWDISLGLSFALGFLLAPLLIAVLFLLRRYPRARLVFFVFLLTEAASQAVGRSFLKFFLDFGLWCTVIGHHVIHRLYPCETIFDADPKEGTLLHAELLGLLRTMVNVCLFAIGTLGISVVSNLVSPYFAGPLGQGTAWCHGLSIFYLALGMFWLLLLPLYRCVRFARARAAGAGVSATPTPADPQAARTVEECKE